MTRVTASLAAILTLALVAVGCGQDRGAEGSGSASSSASQGGSGSVSSSASRAVSETDIQETPELEAAVDNYQNYVAGQTDQLVEAVGLFTDAVIAGDVERAKELYGPSRVPWERIEPTAESLGDLDPKIDAREGDVPDEEWTGFHRIEKALWDQNTTKGQEEYAHQLLADAESLQDEVGDLQLEPADLINGSIELLNEVSASKITGEEERYSHTDLYDISANVEGAQAAFDSLEPALEQENPELVAEIEERLDVVYETLEPYRDGDEGWVSYTELDEGERRQLSQAVDALAELLSQVAQVLEA
jgi:iron uptake system component EfeO